MDFASILLVLIVAFVAIVALVKSANVADQLRRVERRFAALEQRLAAAPPAAAAAAPSPAPEPQPEPLAAAIEDIPERFRDIPKAPEQAAPEQPQPAAAAAPSAAVHRPGFEEQFGTRWVVWVGGLALALGGIFLVYYTIEQDLIGPGTRVFLGGLLAAALVAAGEWQRREEKVSGVTGHSTAHIPSILTAAGTTVAYATIYVAYAYYGFLAPAAAFVLLGIVALATLAAALLHGPSLAGLGLIGAYVTPLLVSTEKPNFWALYVYLAIVSGAAFALARMRLWRWLALTALVFGFLWISLAFGDLRFEVMSSAAFYTCAGFALVTALIVSGLFYGPPAVPGKVDWVSSTAVAVFLVAAALLVLSDQHDPMLLTVFTALTAATLAIAWRADSAAAAVPVAAALAVLVIMRWSFDPDVSRLIAQAGVAGAASPQPLRSGVDTHLALGAAYGLLFLAAGYFVQGRSNSALVPILWSAAGVLAPVAILIGLYGRITHFERSVPFAFIALALAAIFSWATEQLGKRAPRPGLPTAAALYATGAVAALCLAFTFALEKGWLTIGLALMVPGIAWVGEKRPLPMLRWLAAALVILVILRIGWEPRIVGDDVGKTPIFNWLLYGYGVPAAAFWYAGYLMRRRADDKPSRIVDAAAILFTVLLAVLEIRHLLNDGDVYGDKGGLAELATQVCVGIAMTIGLEHVRERTRSVIHDVGAQLVGGLTLLAIVFGLGVGANPMVTGEAVGGLFLNLILLGYGVSAMLAVVLALKIRGRRPNGYRVAVAVVVVALALCYFSLQVRRFYHGPILTIGPTTNAEQYTYSVVWLAFGVLLLVGGIFLRSQPSRLASAAIITLTIGKVFVVDMSDLTGVYRALSFIGLGLVLVGIGLLYQRLLFPRRTLPDASGVAPPAN
jgi:uncharacterized membrane protein